jgi:hypothetical protein
LGPSFLWVGTTELGVREIQKQSNLFRMGKWNSPLNLPTLGWLMKSATTEF